MTYWPVLLQLFFTSSTFASNVIGLSDFNKVEHPLGHEFYVSKSDSRIILIVKREKSTEVVNLVTASEEEKAKFIEITSTIRSEANKSIGLNDWQMSGNKILPTEHGHIFEFQGSFTDFEGQSIEFLEQQFRTANGLVKLYFKKPQGSRWPSSLKEAPVSLQVWSK